MHAVRHAQSVGDLATLVPSWRRALLARNRAEKTINTYMEAAEQLIAFLRERGMPTEAAKITREHVEAFIAHLVQTRAPATAANRYRGVGSLFKWLTEEGEIRRNPMERMSPPAVPERPVPVLPDAEVKRLLKTCSGASFRDRRDEAIIRVFIDSGLRLSEVANLRLTDDDDTNDVDLDRSILRVVRKGRREGVAFIGKNTNVALDRYIRRARARHPKAHLEWLFLGRKGRVTPSGMRQIVERRGEQAGIKGLHPHALRHLAIHHMKAAGLPDELVMEQAGWSSSAMLHRYASSTRRERLGDAWKKFSPGDRF